MPETIVNLTDALDGLYVAAATLQLPSAIEIDWTRAQLHFPEGTIGSVSLNWFEYATAFPIFMWLVTDQRVQVTRLREVAK